ncbi:hypothetical protein [Pseudonocardia sp. T1-2H]
MAHDVPDDETEVAAGEGEGVVPVPADLEGVERGLVPGLDLDVAARGAR